MPVDRLYASVYLEDDEAYDIWKNDIGLPADHIVRLGKEDNFWEHGTGPCGPSSEIYFDRGPDKGCGQPDCKVGCDCDRFVEFWNLVFTQFNREEDGSYTPLEKRNIDTGGGLERFACLMQDVDNSSRSTPSARSWIMYAPSPPCVTGKIRKPIWGSGW